MNILTTEDPDRESLCQRFLRTRGKTEALVEGLSAEDMMVSATMDTSPPKWHLAHTTWFFDQFILKKLDLQKGEEEYDFLFNSYYKSLGSHLTKSQRNSLSRPGLEEIKKYRQKVTEEMANVIRGSSLSILDDLLPLIQTGIHHEEQHQELLFMDIKRNFFENPTHPRFEAPEFSEHDVRITPVWHHIPGGLHRIGKRRNSQDFTYDNEGDEHQHFVESFLLSSHLVTNGEFLEFIEDRGYKNPLLWLSDGWDLIQREGWEKPLYWQNKEGHWWQMTLAGMIPLDPEAPVSHVSFYEAKAYAEWKGCRLPTEFEWEVAARMEKIEGHFMESSLHEPSRAHQKFNLFSQIHGTLWEWTQSAYLPYPRFEPAGGGIAEYNGKFMCNQMVLRGGSCITPRDHYRVTYRNFYYPHHRWQFSGIRLAKDLI